MITALAIVSCIFALIPAALFVQNLALYLPLPAADAVRRRCSVLIPARNEEANIAAALESILRSEGVNFEIVVLDDGSTDRTAEIVRNFCSHDSRVRLGSAKPLPPRWCGKNFACQQLAAFASHPLLVFMDADVRIAKPDALARLASLMQSGPALASGLPREETIGLTEKLIIPLIHFVLLGFLPLQRMRAGSDPRFAAACGQILAVRREAYEQIGGHASVADRMHDAVALARHFRAHGFRTDLFDATDTFRCRMYRSAAEVWHGFAKNAHEGLAAPRLIIPATVLLLGGQVLPICLLMFAPSMPALIATAAAYLPRIISITRFRQSIMGALLHPLGIWVLVAIQWFGFIRSLRQRPAMWKGRAYSAASA